MCFVIALGFASETEKVYQGKNLDQWVKEFETDPGLERKLVIISALGMFGKDSFAILEKLAVAANNDVRAKSISTLGQMGKTAVPSLAKIASNGPKSSRLLALMVLSGLGNQAIESLPELCKLMTHFDKDTKLRAIAAVGNLGIDGFASLPFLLVAVRSTEGETAEIAYRSLFQVCGWNAAPEGNIFEASMKVAITKGELGVGVLAQLLKDVDPEIRINAAKLLGGLGPKAAKAMPALQSALQDKSDKVIDAAFEAIQKIKP